jgi:four helix bundle suffix protein
MARRKDGSPATYADYERFVETRDPAVVSNLVICLIHQANFLLDRQIARLEKDFLANGGIRERMMAARLKAREKK